MIPDFRALRGRRVTIVEVGPRDGLQNEREIVTTDDKVAFVDMLSDAGLPAIEVTAFVNPARVPQMEDGDSLLRGIRRSPSTRYSALVPNMRGLERAMEAGVQDIAVFAAASETFSQRNIGKSIESSMAVYTEVCAAALAADIGVRAYLSVSFGCPYEGDVPEHVVVALTERLLAMGADEVGVSDTIGCAHPGAICRVLDALLARVPPEHIALHLHDTRGTALANVVTALCYGIDTFDASAGGFGGCPFAPGAAGNLATEDLLYAMHGLGIETGVSLDRVVTATRFISQRCGRAAPSRYVEAIDSASRRLPSD